MIKTRAGYELLRFLEDKHAGEIIDRYWLRDYIKSRVPTGRAPVRTSRQGNRNQSSDGSAATKNLNGALRELERKGVLTRDKNFIRLKDLSLVPRLIQISASHFARSAKHNQGEKQ